MRSRFGTQFIKVTPVFLGGALMGTVLSGTVFAYQGHMWSALDQLKAAKSELLKAESDKGGHRVRAINLVDQAIVQTNEGIKVGRQ